MGDHVRIIASPDLCYGSKGFYPLIPANSALIIQVGRWRQRVYVSCLSELRVGQGELLRRKSTLVSSYTPRVSRRVEGWGWWGLFAVTNSEQGCVGNSHVSVSSQNQVELLECEPSNPAMTGGSVPIATMRPQFLPRPCSGHAGSAGTLMLPWMICFGFPGRSTSSS